MRTAGSSRTTTLWGGVGLLVGGVLWILDVHIWFPHIVSGAVWVAVDDLIICAAAVVLAVGVRHETGIVGRFGWGAAAVILFGARNLALSGFGWILVATIPFPPVGPSSTTIILINTVLIISFALATLAAGIAMVRARVLHGFARWPLLALGCCYVLATAFIFVNPGPAGVVIEYLEPLLLIVTGLSYALHGQSASIRARAKIINEQW